MVAIYHIKNLAHSNYLCAGDVWDGTVYNQQDNQRPNAAWVVVPTDGPGSNLIDLRHGKCLMNGEGYRLHDRGFEVAHAAVHPLDLRARWQKIAVSQELFTLTDGYRGRRLNGDSSSIHLSAPDLPVPDDAKWIFEPASSAYFPQTRLMLPADRVIRYHVELVKDFALVTRDKVMEAIAEAIRQWVDVLNHYAPSANFTAQRVQEKPTAAVAFRWGALNNDGQDDAAGTRFGGYAEAQGAFQPTQSQAFITFNEEKIWSVSPPGAISGPLIAYDILSVAAHELGHALGLEHSPDSSSPMQPKIETGQIWTRKGGSICASDMLRIRARYWDVMSP